MSWATARCTVHFARRQSRLRFVRELRSSAVRGGTTLFEGALQTNEQPHRFALDGACGATPHKAAAFLVQVRIKPIEEELLVILILDSNIAKK